MQAQVGRWFCALMMALTLAWVASPTLAEEEAATEGKVAVVNGAVITRVDLDKEMSRLQRQLFRLGETVQGSTSSEIESGALENLIDFELLYQEGLEKGIKVDEAALDERLNAMKIRFPSEAEYENALADMNLSETALKSQFERSMTIEQFIDEYFGQKVMVSDEESKAYYDDNLDSFKQAEQVQASHILIKVDPQADESQKAEARKKLEEIQQKLNEGRDFASLAEEFSECSSRSRRGDLGYLRRGQAVKPFENAAFALNVGEMSDIVETEFGYHLIRIADKKPETIIPYDEIKDSLSQYLKQKKVREAVKVHLAKLKEEAAVERFLPEAQE